MIDIFISYSREDKAWVSKLAKALETEGYVVWWDPEILPGQDFEEIIQEALIKAKCVITVWSESSIQSIWVKDESSRAYERKVLVPILYHDVKPPMPFGRIHSANLQKWKGRNNDPYFQQLLRAINIESNDSDKARTLLESSSHRATKNNIKSRMIAIGVALLIFIGISILASYIRDIKHYKTITIGENKKEKIENTDNILDKSLVKKRETNKNDKTEDKLKLTNIEESYTKPNRCVDKRLNSEQIRKLVNDKIAIGIRTNVKNPVHWKETHESNGVAYYEQKGKVSEGRWKVENNQICWCYGDCSSYTCKYIEQRNNCTSWYYIDSFTGKETSKVHRWLNIRRNIYHVNPCKFTRANKFIEGTC